MAEPESQSVPPDPFAQGHASCVAVVENFRSYRRAGASWLEAIGLQASIFVAGHIAASGQGDG